MEVQRLPHTIFCRLVAIFVQFALLLGATAVVSAKVPTARLIDATVIANTNIYQVQYLQRYNIPPHEWFQVS